MQRKDLAFVFPGQGSQSLGMLSELASVHAEVEKTFAEASDVLGFNLWQVVQGDSQDALNQTVNTQPAMLAAGVAVWHVWQAQSEIRPVWMAGHSLGEYTALVCSGAMAFADAVKLVAMRGRLMQQAVPEGQGAMAVVLGLGDDEVRAVCKEAAAGQVCEAVNFNAPGQVVMAGDAAAIDRACALAKAKGAKRAQLLPVSVPSHCALMRPAAEALAEQLANTRISAPQVPVIQNADVQSFSQPEDIRLGLAKQLYSPVRWVETVEFLVAQGVTQLIECGPGKVLMGLNKRIVKDLSHATLLDLKTLESTLEALS